MEIILSDFARAHRCAEKDEREGKASFYEVEKDTKEDVAQKQSVIRVKEGEVSDAEAEITDQQQALMDAQDLLDSSKDVLESLETMCVKGAETFAERKKKREDEIDALTDALQILENWKGA